MGSWRVDKKAVLKAFQTAGNSDATRAEQRAEKRVDSRAGLSADSRADN